MRSTVALFVAFALATVFSLPAAPVALCGGDVGEQTNIELAMGQVMKSNLTYSCDECFEMMQALSGYCKHHTNSKNTLEAFHQHCYEQTIGITLDYDTVFNKCEQFHKFVSTLFCPLDPCVQVTQSIVKAPRAICDLMKCQTIKLPVPGIPESFPPTIPLSCPSYMSAIVEYCHAKPQDEPLTNASCARFPSRFQREGCWLVVSNLIRAASPMDFCATNECNALPESKYHEYCEHVLHLPPVEPIPAPAYLAYLESLKVRECEIPKGFGINVTYATYGRNCSLQNVTNNILKTVKSRCDGQVRCTFGNPDMSSSNWDPVAHDLSPFCTREFEIRYSCQRGGKVHTIVAPEETKFKALPFDCMPELESRLQHDENFSGMTFTHPRDVPLYL